MRIDNELADKVARALSVAIALAKPGSPMHTQIMEAANAFDDAINEVDYGERDAADRDNADPQR